MQWIRGNETAKCLNKRYCPRIQHDVNICFDSPRVNILIECHQCSSLDASFIWDTQLAQFRSNSNVFMHEIVLKCFAPGAFIEQKRWEQQKEAHLLPMLFAQKCDKPSSNRWLIAGIHDMIIFFMHTCEQRILLWTRLF